MKEISITLRLSDSRVSQMHSLLLTCLKVRVSKQPSAFNGLNFASRRDAAVSYDRWRLSRVAVVAVVWIVRNCPGPVLSLKLWYTIAAEVVE